jgi:DNA-binding GntR family transcriptional regulator
VAHRALRTARHLVDHGHAPLVAVPATAVSSELGAPAPCEDVEEGRWAAQEGDWNGLGTVNIHCHREPVTLAGSGRTDELMRGVFAGLRLAFHVVDGPRRVREPYLTRNQRILQALRKDEREKAERLLAVCLDDSLEGVVEVYRRRLGRDGER